MSKDKVVYFRIDVMSGSTGKLLVALHLPEDATIDEAREWMADKVDEVVSSYGTKVRDNDDWDTYCKATEVDQNDTDCDVDVSVFRGGLGELDDFCDGFAEQDDTEVLA